MISSQEGGDNNLQFEKSWSQNIGEIVGDDVVSRNLYHVTGRKFGVFKTWTNPLVFVIYLDS